MGHHAAVAAVFFLAALPSLASEPGHALACSNHLAVPPRRNAVLPPASASPL